VTLGTGDDEQMIDSLHGMLKKKFLLHYNFPPFSVGEVGRFGGQGRREIGHGNLAERAVKAIIPDFDKFPYTIRIVADVLESNGSSSMGTVCSGILALLDAGVPIKGNVAGIAMGLIKEDDRVAVLTDILGDEDHLGDMDFKVAGTAQGITAVQMDIKIDSVSFEVMETALNQARDGRLHILAEMEKVISTPRGQISEYAPRIETIKINPDKIREVIGSGGKVIRGITEQTGVKIEIEDDGKIHIASADPEATKRAIAIIQGIVAEAEVGKTYKGRVVKIADFGAFVEILPNTQGLLHISEISHERIRAVGDVLNEGDELDVKVLDVDRAGRIKLSRKVLLSKEQH
jgi:polyribonucleotide nucleotidyltransferase